MTQYFSNPTVIPFSMQAKDWFVLISQAIGDDAYENLIFQLKNAMRVQNPPSGTTLIQVNESLGVILYLYNKIQGSLGKEIGKNTRNRFKTELETQAISHPVITNFLTDLTLMETTQENLFQETGRKFLRGKLG